MEEYAIEVSNLKIWYRSLTSLSIKRDLLRRKRNDNKKFEALGGISFQVPKGSIMGVIGRNGSGKSTLLKAIAGIFAPDEGEIDLKGQSVSLMSIGVGFQPLLTGRENILLSALLLGFSVDAIDRRMDEIIEFSELKDFIDKPVRTYSSGMYSKLAFSITAVLETDILLIDEILSVGDSQFQNKSLEKIKQLINDENRTVLIVSHNMQILMELCHRVLWLQDGFVVGSGEPKDMIERYCRTQYAPEITG